MDLLSMLQSQLSDDVLQQLSRQVDAAPDQTASATNSIFAALVGGLAGNTASSENGLQSLVMALDRDHDGSILDDLGGVIALMGSGNATDSRALNGAGILSHILGERQEMVAQQIGQSTGLSTQQIIKLMSLLAPIVMAVLGRMRQSGQLDMGGLLQALVGAAQNAQSSGHGDLVGTLLSTVLSGRQAQQSQSDEGGLLGGLLGSLLGKR
ncbi:MAG: DUF937 domain-containing protein [Saprospiraceae bacterium]|nr:DUF937 domain-containing protein [Saprospiraceae bacterium]MDW8485101.1 DUF937 domain-containing protein [Saprospiraceae bacterium]